MNARRVFLQSFIPLVTGCYMTQSAPMSVPVDLSDIAWPPVTSLEVTDVIMGEAPAPIPYVCGIVRRGSITFPLNFQKC